MTSPAAADDIFGDLEAEQAALDAVLAGLSPADWERPSAAAGWSVADVMLHLAQTEELVSAAVAGTKVALSVEPGGPAVDEVAGQLVEAERGAAPDEVYRRWCEASRAAVGALRGCGPGTRLTWVAAQMSPRSLATTRLAEHWAHALDITGPLGLPYPDTSRLRHVAWLAVRTLPYAFALAGQDAGPVRCELAAPGGGTWRLGPDEAPSVIAGPAGAFCRVAAQRLAAAQAGLTTAGPDGARALSLIRTYA